MAAGRATEPKKAATEKKNVVTEGKKEGEPMERGMEVEKGTTAESAPVAEKEKTWWEWILEEPDPTKEKPWWDRILEEPDPVIDYDAILCEDDPEILEARELAEQQEKERVAEEEGREERAREAKQRDINLRFYGIREEPEEEKDYMSIEEQWKRYPVDPEEWTERDLGEEWIDRPPEAKGIAYDPHALKQDKMVDHKEEMVLPRRRGFLWRKRDKRQTKLPEGVRYPKFYTPYREPLPPIFPTPEFAGEFRARPGPRGALNYMDTRPEYLEWDSYVFRDGSQPIVDSIRSIANMDVEDPLAFLDPLP